MFITRKEIVIKRRNISLGFPTEPLISGERKKLGEDCIDDHCHGFKKEEQEDMVHGNSHCQNENEKIQDLVDQEIASGLHAIYLFPSNLTYFVYLRFDII